MLILPEKKRSELIELFGFDWFSPFKNEEFRDIATLRYLVQYLSSINQ